MDEAIAAFLRLKTDEQVRVLVAYAARLTIVARDTYIPLTDGVADPSRLRFLNECQHRILSHISALLARSTQRYPDDVLIRTIAGEDDAELVSAFAAALAQS